MFIFSLRGVIRELKRFSHYLMIDDHLILASTKYTIKHNINALLTAFAEMDIRSFLPKTALRRHVFETHVHWFALLL